MKLEDQVASLELCKRLKGLNVKQESLFTWERYDIPKHSWGLTGKPILRNDPNNVAAFTVAELGEMLPPECFSIKAQAGWRSAFPAFVENSIGVTEADARAKMLIHLIEQKLVKP